jgi:uncharacterized paraquat-inducible protein A
MELTTAETTLQQIVGSISFVVASILLIGASIVNAINKLIYEVRDEKDTTITNAITPEDKNSKTESLPMVCPKCLKKYDEITKTCPNCNVELKDRREL